MNPVPVTHTFVLLLYLVFLTGLSGTALAQHPHHALADKIGIALAEEGLTGAAWSVKHADGTTEYGHAGFSDAETSLAFSANTRFHVGSVTKSLLATGILRLVSTGKLELDQPAEQYLPDLPFSNPWKTTDPVTVRHLLDHTSGLDDARLWQMFSSRVKPDTPLIEAFQSSTEILNIRSRPGSRFSYSNMGYGLLGLMIETVSGERYESFLDRELLKPLGMLDSTFAFTTQVGAHADPALAWGHVDDGGRYPAAPIMLRPAGQFTTTTADWMRFAEFLMGDGSINGQSFIPQELMSTRGHASTTMAWLAGLEVGYALGLSKLDRYGAIGLCHLGNIVGFNAMMCVYPNSSQAFVISINTDSETADYKRIYQIVASSLSFPDLPEPESALPAVDASDWQGLFILQPNRFQSFRYLDMLFGFARLEWSDGTLIFDPFQGKTRQLRPTGSYLLSANDRRGNSHVLIRGDNGSPLLGDGYRTYARVNPSIIYGLWFSLGLGLAGMVWLALNGGLALFSKGLSGFLTAPGVALLGILGLLAPIPLFFTQSFMSLGDKTPASVLLATATVMLPVSMLVAHGLIVRNPSRDRINTLHGISTVAVLQWCAVLYYFDLLPLRLWV